MLSLLKTRPCMSHDITIIHLQRRLKSLDKRVQKTHATTADYTNRERVARQLTEAKAYLC